MADVVSTPNEGGPHRYAKAPHLWALGVGAVISGDFYGWQAALIAGFDGMLIILSIITVMYVFLAFSIAELSSMLPTGGGPYVFALHGIGRKSAFFAGLAECLKVVTTCAVANTGIASYLTVLLGTSDNLGPMWWALFYILFVGLNVMGVEMSFRIQLVATLISVLMLVIFFVGAMFNISYDEWVVAQDWKYNNEGGWDGAIRGISFTLWFYLGIEELPLAVEETIDPVKNMPRGLVSSMITLVLLAFGTAIFNSMISPGAYEIYNSVTPLLDGYKSVFGDTNTTAGFTWITIVGLISSFHSFIFCMSKLLFAIARDGFLPKFLTKTHPTRGTAHVALITGSLIGYIVAVALHYIIGDLRLGSVLINMTLIGALVSYAFQLTAFIRLRIVEPERERPYRSPFGVPGAVIALLLCAVSLFGIIYSGASDSDFLWSIIGAALVFIIGAVYFFKTVLPSLNERETVKDIREDLLSNKL